MIEPAKVMVDGCQFDRSCPSGFFDDEQSTAIEPPCIREATHVFVKDAQIVQDANRFYGVLSEGLNGERESPFIKDFGGFIPALNPMICCLLLQTGQQLGCVSRSS